MIDNQLKSYVKKIIDKELEKICNIDLTINSIKNNLPYTIINNQKFTSWDDITVSCGIPSICIFLAEADCHFPELNLHRIAHQYIIKIQTSINNMNWNDLSLFNGLSGIGFMALMLSKNKTRYVKLIDSINYQIIANLPKLIHYFQESFQNNDLKMGHYDIIQGLSGIGRYLIFFKEDSVILDIIKLIINYLIDITKFIQINDHKVPGWYISKSNQFTDYDRLKYPNGNFNLGLSHGITGVLAFFAISLSYGICDPFQQETIKIITSWLLNFSYFENESKNWPCHISFEDYMNGHVSENNKNTQLGWCYGSLGVARTLWLVGSILNAPELQNISIDTFKNITCTPIKKIESMSSTFCHGISGVIHMFNLMYKDTLVPEFQKFINMLIQILLDKYDDNYVFGFRSINWSLGKKIECDSIGLLDGTAGILLSFLACIYPMKTKWDSVFLLN